MTRIGLILLASFMATASVNAERPRFDSGRQWILVTTNEFQTAVSPLVRHRSSQGWKTEVIVIAATDLGATRAEGGPQTAGLLKERLSQHVADFSGSSCVLIVGHWTTAGTESPTGEHGRMRGAWTDHSLGFPDEDGAATVAVGRLPAKNVEQVKTYVAKILAYENTPTDQNHISLLVGDPGGRSAVEQAIAAQFIKGTVANRLERVDVAWDVDCVMDIDGSKYSAQGDAFSDHVAKALGTNQQFAIYCGHSGPSGMMTRKGNLSFEAMLGDSEPKGRTGVFLTTGCYACQARGFGGQGYGLDLLGAAEGPAAVIGAYAESYAAAGQLALDGALQCLSSHSQGDSKSQGNAASKADEKSRAEFVGDYWLAVQAGLARGKISPAEFYLYDRADGSNGTVSLEDQRKEHLEMWGLFGDPAMPIPTVQVTE